MSEMIERAAKALIQARDTKRDFRLNPFHDEEMAEAKCEARAVIEEMRELTDEMLTAGGNAVHARDPYEDEQIAMARGVWNAAIDAALSQSGEG